MGAVILPITTEKLIPRIGFAWSVRCIALIQFFTLAISVTVMKSRLQPRKAGPLVDPSAFKQVSYTAFTLGLAFAFWGLFIPFFYSTAYVTEVGAPEHLVRYVLAMMNVYPRRRNLT
jgi:hypothetical protein